METVYIISALIGALIFYLIINRAVFHATHENLKAVNDSMRLANQLKIMELKKNGFTDEEIQRQIDFVYPKK